MWCDKCGKPGALRENLHLFSLYEYLVRGRGLEQCGIGGREVIQLDKYADFSSKLSLSFCDQE